VSASRPCSPASEDERPASSVPFCWSVPGWELIPGLRHGFFGRTGGESVDAFASFNLSDRVGDDGRAVARNRGRAERLLEPLRLVIPVQVHGDRVATVEGAAHAPGESDALITSEPGWALCVLTADCVPILLVAPEVHAIAAVHAGWRGTVQGVVVRTIEEMRNRLGVRPEQIRAALGPAIGPCCYEVSSEVAGAMSARHGPCPGIVEPATTADRARLDLRAVNRALVERCGVPKAQVVLVGPCTCCVPSRCFSYRGSSGRTGRQLSFVGWDA